MNTDRRKSSGPSWVSRLTALPLVAMAGMVALPTVTTGDWSHFRGPNYDGSSDETIRINWSELPPAEIWKVPLDPALSSLSVSGGRVFTQVRRTVQPPASPDDPTPRRQSREVCIAMDAATGEELWAISLDQAFYPDGYVGGDDGPRSTPVVDGDHVYVLTSYLRLYCLSASTGEIVWSRDFIAEFGSNGILWQNSASPLLVDDLVIVNTNSPGQCLMAFRKDDGSVVWKVEATDGLTHATPVIATIAGVRQVVFYVRTGLTSLVPETGEVLWRFRPRFPSNVLSDAASPVVGNDVVYFSTANTSGGAAVRVTRDGDTFEVTELWATRGRAMNEYVTPIWHDGHLYGMYAKNGATLRCLEFETGLQIWENRETFSNREHGALLSIAGKILYLTKEGDLVLFEPSPESYQELARFKAVTGGCWNVPAISNGRLYVRSAREAACYDVSLSTTSQPPLRLSPEGFAPDGSFQLRIHNDDGSPFESSRQSNIDVYVTTDLDTEWLKLENSTAVKDGGLHLTDPESRTLPNRYYRVEERP